MKTILVIDDDQDVASSMTELLVVSGFIAFAFTNSIRALAAVDASVGLLVVDHTMPNLSGLDVIRAAHVKYPNLPAILLSGYVSASGTAKRLGVTFAMKPIEPIWLIAAVKAALGLENRPSI